MERLKKAFSAQPVLLISFAAALISAFFVPPDKDYLGYLNINVFIQLFALMTAVSGLRAAGILDLISATILKKTGTVRKLGLALALVCFFTSMAVTNDVALLTFVPVSLLVFKNIKDEKSKIFTIVLQTAAANLGSMVTPVGNPQNLFIFEKYHLGAAEFFKTTLPVGAIGLVIVIALSFFLPNSKISETSRSADVCVKDTAAFSLLFVAAILCVLRILANYLCLAAAVVVPLIFNRKAFKNVDFCLLLTFLCFFVFVGNVGRIDAVVTLVPKFLSGREILVSAALSQIISNVPAAVMLSGFTGDARSLLLGVNIGGLGTLVASLASLISFQLYKKEEQADTRRYLAVFSAVNFSGLAMLLLVGVLFG